MKSLAVGLLVLASLGSVAGLISAVWADREDMRPHAEESAGPGAQCTVEPTEFDFRGCPVGSQDVTIRITNHGDHPCQIIGFSNGCATNCCYQAIRQDRVTVEPHATVEYVFEFAVRGPGPFEGSPVVFLDDGGARAVPIQIRGTSVELP